MIMLWRRSAVVRAGRPGPGGGPPPASAALFQMIVWVSASMIGMVSGRCGLGHPLASCRGLAGGEPVGLGAGFDDVGVEGDAVDDGGDEAGGGGHRAPLAGQPGGAGGDGGPV